MGGGSKHRSRGASSENFSLYMYVAAATVRRACSVCRALVGPMILIKRSELHSIELVEVCGGCAKPHKWAVLHQRSDKPLIDNGTTPSTQYHRCLPEEMEALGCAYGRSMDMVSIAQLAVEGNPQQLEPV